MSAAKYPLTWPETMARRHGARDKGAFKSSLSAAINNVTKSLNAFARDSGKAIDGIVLSSNVTLGENRPADPGVAVWFVWDGLQVCIPVDRYQTVEANLQAIHHIIEARRVELRHGTLALVRASFTGFTALPAPAGSKPPNWREILGFDDPSAKITKNIISAAYRLRALDAHPDARGGSQAAMQELNEARAQALKEIGE